MKYNTQKQKPILILDFETSALINEGGRPIEIGALLIERETLLPVEHRFDFWGLIRPSVQCTWTDEAINTHGRTFEYIQEKGVTEDIIRWKFLHWLESHGIKTWLSSPQEWPLMKYWDKAQIVVCGQNVEYDLKCFEMLFGTRELFSHRVIDTQVIANFMNLASEDAYGCPIFTTVEGHESTSLDNQLRTMGLSREYDTHCALEDVNLTHRLLSYHIGALSNTLKGDTTTIKERIGK